MPRGDHAVEAREGRGETGTKRGEGSLLRRKRGEREGAIRIMMDKRGGRDKGSSCQLTDSSRSLCWSVTSRWISIVICSLVSSNTAKVEHISSEPTPTTVKPLPSLFVHHIAHSHSSVRRPYRQAPATARRSAVRILVRHAVRAGVPSVRTRRTRRQRGQCGRPRRTRRGRR